MSSGEGRICLSTGTPRTGGYRHELPAGGLLVGPACRPRAALEPDRRRLAGKCRVAAAVPTYSPEGAPSTVGPPAGGAPPPGMPAAAARRQRGGQGGQLHPRLHRQGQPQAPSRAKSPGSPVPQISSSRQLPSDSQVCSQARRPPPATRARPPRRN